MKYICMNCEERFDEPAIIDEGIGDYEYGGARGRHVVEVKVSPCCEEGFDVEDDEE
jgi:hypothetical protein